SLFFTAPATSPIYTLSLHDALPISGNRNTYRPHVAAASDRKCHQPGCATDGSSNLGHPSKTSTPSQRGSSSPRQSSLQHRSFHRSEEHTSELQSRFDLVCRLLLEKK